MARVAFMAAVLAQGYALYVFSPEPSLDPGIPHLDKVVHAAIFAVPAFLAVIARLPLRVVVPLLAVHAPFSEMVQHYLIPGRFGDPLDMIADWVGILLGLVAAGWWLRRRFGVRGGRPLD